jgi:hypothetical protein
MWLDVFPLWPLTVIATVGLGAALRPALFGPGRLTRAEVLAWDFLLGSGLVGYLMMAAGHAGILRPWIAWCTLLIGAGVGLIELRTVGLRSPFRAASAEIRALHGLTALALVWHAWGCLTPAFGGDALNYHLGAPRDWIDAGQIIETPLRFQSAISGHHLMIYTWCLLIGDDVLCKLTQFTQFLAALVLVAALTRRLGGRAAGALAACLAVMCITAAWYRTPVFVRSDLTTLLFSAGALWAAVRCAATGRLLWAAASGVAAGLAVATKYTALPFLILPLGIALPFALLRRTGRPGPALRGIGVAALAGTLLFGPWMIRGWIVTGDPLYPLLSDLLPVKPDYEECRRLMDEYQASFALPAAPTLAHSLWLSWRQKANHAVTEGDFLLLLLPAVALFALFHRRPGVSLLGVYGVAATVTFAALPVAELGRGCGGT